MRTDALLERVSARDVDLAPLRGRALTLAAPLDRLTSFDRLTIGLHWATVVLVLALFATAWLHALADGRHSDLAPILLQVHRSFGVTTWIVTALRLAWRRTHARLPPFPSHMSKPHRATVKFSEYGLYALLLVQPATGMLTTLSSGRPFALFLWSFSPLMARNVTLQGAFHRLHELGAWALAALVLGHAAAALFHHVVLRDHVLARIAPVMQRQQRRPTGRSGP
jgi:cytochrome b561